MMDEGMERGEEGRQFGEAESVRIDVATDWIYSCGEGSSRRVGAGYVVVVSGGS